jgi:hypothetical protein
LFWKKKKKVEFELDPQHDDSRSAYRMAPDRSKPVLVSIKGSSFNALNISGSGIAFRSHNFPEGTQTHATIRLPSEDRIFSVKLEIVSKHQDLCRCRFLEIHQQAEDLLHSYILELQKKKIRQNKGLAM